MHAPLGAGWLSWHEARITNAISFLEQNGYFTNYGFTIWSDCTDCDISSSNWNDQIYLSMTFFSISPYIILSYFFGIELIAYSAPYIDKLVILITGILIAEMSVSFLRSNFKAKHLTGILIFTFFIINPWTYKMLLASWSEIYFLLFFLFAVLSINKSNYFFGSVFFLIAGLFNFVWSGIFFLFYFSTIFFKNILEIKDPLSYFPSDQVTPLKHFSYIVFLSIPVVFMITLQFLFNTSNITIVSTPLLERIGISGDDIHNGGILGALQFLGGNRITQCFYDYDSMTLSMDLNQGIQAFNCGLSIAGMGVLSLIAIIGALQALRKYPDLQKIITPISFGVIFCIFIFQQALSAHLMGYSYMFGPIFAVGLSYSLIRLLDFFETKTLGYTTLLPIFVGICFFCIHVNMLTGPNG